jgi:hypothetical protein
LGSRHARFLLGAGDGEFLELNQVVDDRLHGLPVLHGKSK